MSYDVKNDRTNGELMPKALVHIKILDAARTDPTASFEAIADEIDGASIDLVDRVLKKYGDPGSTEAATRGGDTTEEGETMDDAPPGNQHDTEEVTDAEQKGPTTTTRESTVTGDTRSTDAEQQSPNSNESRAISDTLSGTDEASTENPVVTGDQTLTDTQVDQAASGNEDSVDGSSDSISIPDYEQLTRKQREVLRAIRERPYATQSELADRFDVSRATISQRVNAIDGFEWAKRRELIDVMFDGGEPIDASRRKGTFDELAANIEDLTERVAALEEAILETSTDCDSSFDDPMTVGTIIRACIDSNTIPEEKEEEIIVQLIQAGRS